MGGEVGVNVEPVPNLTVRGTWFDNRIENPVSNVTIAVSGATITQQRQNLGRTRVRGVQTDVEYRLGADWRLGAGYLYNDAKVTEDTRAALVGKSLAQVPQHRGSARVAYTNPRIAVLALGVQAIGRQFDDDLNVRTIGGSTEPGLPPYAVVDFTASRAMTAQFRRILRCAEHPGRGVLRRHEPDDDRFAAAGSRRRARAILGTVRPRPGIGMYSPFME